MVEEETEEEVEAAIAVYGADCVVIRRSPPHLLVRLQPRTANDISQQFVEAVLVIKASSKYPSEPPVLELQDMKGLEDGKVVGLLSELRDLADELTSNPMLVAICEEALDRLTEMNQPDGNCCFCMEPLVMENKFEESRHFMKLLSCFHCFHSECFVRWWRWMLQRKDLDNSDLFLGLRLDKDKDMVASCTKLLEEAEMKCPVCRKFIDALDLASIWSNLVADLGQEQEIVPDTEVIFSKSEIARKAKFDELFRAQQHRGGIIEPRKLEVIVPGMFVSLPSTTRAAESEEKSGPALPTLQASESSSLLAGVEGESLSQDIDQMRQPEQDAVDAQGQTDVGGTSKSTGRVSHQPHQRKSKRLNHTGPKRGYWVRRDHEGCK